VPIRDLDRNTQPACGDRAPKGGREFSASLAREEKGAIEESEVVIWVGGVLFECGE